ncbi:MAG: rod shape-determining protein MreD [Lachnospiraceae bacterium]|nr:rod shape-determining protein MreD [Lachnospiraceae bacterium]
MIILFLLQHTVFTNLSIGNIIPDLLIILIFAVAYQNGKVAGIFVGISCGLMLDLTFGSVLGVYALCYMFIGYFCGFLATYYIKSDLILPLAVITVSEFVFSFYCYIVNRLIYGDTSLAYYFKRIMIPKVAYTLLLSVIVYKLLDYIYISILLQDEEDN